MIYCFDLDNTLCKTEGADYKNATPIEERIQRVNHLYIDNEIIIYTARGATTGQDWLSLTEKQLSAWKVRYHRLVFGKPTADIYVDDKGIRDNVFFES